MITDIRTHIWSSLDQLGREIAEKLRGRASERFEQMEAVHADHDRAMRCVDASLVFGFRSDRLGARVPNEMIAEFVSQEPSRRLGVAGIDPMSADAIEQVESASRLGLVGISVSPACQGFHPAHSAAMRVYERCAALSMPLFVTMLEPLTPGAVLEFARPALWNEVALSFSRLPIVIGQIGHPWVDETLVLLGQHANVFADIGGVASRPWQLFNALLSANSMSVMDRLLFASGFPFDTPARAIESLYSINTFSHGTQLPAVPRAQIRGIVERDSLACLGIETEAPVARVHTSDEAVPTVETAERTEVHPTMRAGR